MASWLCLANAIVFELCVSRGWPIAFKGRISLGFGNKPHSVLLDLDFLHFGRAVMKVLVYDIKKQSPFVLAQCTSLLVVILLNALRFPADKRSLHLVLMCLEECCRTVVIVVSEKLRLRARGPFYGLPATIFVSHANLIFFLRLSLVVLRSFSPYPWSFL